VTLEEAIQNLRDTEGKDAATFNAAFDVVKKMKAKAKRDLRFAGVCPTCEGSGKRPYYNHIMGGVCVPCKGSGKAA